MRTNGEEQTNREEERMSWWHEAKFGMFVHWGCYSVLGRGEQVILRDFMPLEEYRAIAERFHPADDWADHIADQAVRAGARYVVLTTRHHLEDRARHSVCLASHDGRITPGSGNQ